MENLNHKVCLRFELNRHPTFKYCVITCMDSSGDEAYLAGQEADALGQKLSPTRTTDPARMATLRIRGRQVSAAPQAELAVKCNARRKAIQKRNCVSDVWRPCYAVKAAQSCSTKSRQPMTIIIIPEVLPTTAAAAGRDVSSALDVNPTTV